MLTNLYVKNLALIDEIEVEFSAGLNILTGETGAGKSIILGSIALALGGKYAADMLRKDAPYGLVELTFLVDNEQVRQSVEALGIYPEDGQLVLSRRLMEGRSTAKINGETVNKSLLGQVAELLIHVHGQHEHQTLLSKRNHLALLDLYCQEPMKQAKAELGLAFENYKKASKALLEADMDESERRKEMAFLEFEIQEIDGAALKDQEDVQLEELYQQMVVGKRLAEHLSEAYQYTGGASGDNASDLLSRAVASLRELEQYNEQGASLYNQLAEIDSLLNDFNREMASFQQSLDFSEAAFYEVENRLNEINHLKVKYGDSVAAILSYQEEQQKRLEELEHYEVFLADLKTAKETAQVKLEKDSQKVSALRQKGAKKFVKEIRQGLEDMNFLAVEFEMPLQVTEQYSANGVDEAEFYISTNPGEPLKPLSDVASGGELSRVMLAIKAVLAEADETLTLIFDEIDTGISGITAGKVAAKLLHIASARQVICITHLPQIAAVADAHYIIEKQSEGNRTQTDIHLLDGEASIQELARILGGENITDNLLQSAREMKNLDYKN